MHVLASKTYGLLKIVPALMLAFSVSAHAFDGDYEVSGRNPDGSTYKGQVSIQSKQDGTCLIAWAIRGMSFKGRCLVRGRSLAASYSDGTGQGLVVYEADSNGQIVGNWSLAGVKGLGEERLALRPK